LNQLIKKCEQIYKRVIDGICEFEMFGEVDMIL